MIQIGKISLRGPVGPPRYSRFSANEARTHMTFWCIYRSPLMLGGNLPDNRAMEDSLFTNEEVLAVNQHGEHPWQVYKNDSAMVWSSGTGEGSVDTASWRGTDQGSGAIGENVVDLVYEKSHVIGAFKFMADHSYPGRCTSPKRERLYV